MRNASLPATSHLKSVSWFEFGSEKMRESNSDTAVIRQFMNISRAWLIVDEGGRVLRLPRLEEDLVLAALKQGAVAEYAGWSIKVTPSRRIGDLSNETEYAPGVLATSAHGFAIGLRVDVEGVRHVCKQIMGIEQRGRTDLDAKIEGKEGVRWEFDEG
jgi:hypothetical protein